MAPLNEVWAPGRMDAAGQMHQLEALLLSAVRHLLCVDTDYVFVDEFQHLGFRIKRLRLPRHTGVVIGSKSLLAPATLAENAEVR